MKSLDVIPAGTGYSTSKGGVVEGERMLVGYIHKAKGTGSRPHSHPNEQFNYILQGTLDVEIDGQKFQAKAGSVVYVPANMEHSMVALPEEDVIFIAIKDFFIWKFISQPSGFTINPLLSVDIILTVIV